MDPSSIDINADLRVTIYAAPGCGWCHATEALLTKLGIEYHRIELGLDPQGREELMRQTGRIQLPAGRARREGHVRLPEGQSHDHPEQPRAAAPPTRDVIH